MTLTEKLNAYERLMRLDKPIGILLLLWPTLWAADSLRHARRQGDFPWGPRRPKLPRSGIWRGIATTSFIVHFISRSSTKPIQFSSMRRDHPLSLPETVSFLIRAHIT